MNLPRPVVLAGASLAVLAALVATVLVGARLLQRGEVIRGISVAGVDVGGLSDADARRALAPIVAAREADPVLLTHADTSIELDPATIGYRVDLDRTVTDLMAVGRDEGFLPDTVRQVQAFWREHGAELQVSWDEEALDRFLAEVAEEVDTEPSPGAIAADPDTLEVTAEAPQDGITVLRERTREVVLTALRAPGPDTAEIPVEVQPTTVAMADVEAVAEQARRAIAEPMTLRNDVADADLVLDPSDLARLVTLDASESEGRTTVALAADPAAVVEVFDGRTERFEVDPVSARFDVPREPPVTLDDKEDVTWRPRPADVDVVPSTPGRRFSAELATRQLTDLLRAGTREGILRLEEVEAELTTAEAEELGITELLGTFTTYHQCCQSRVHNIQRLADMVDGTLVLPGEQFSINQISGNRTCGKGFAEAGMILNGEIVDVCGGGVSQFGTTTVNAVFFSGLTPDDYKPHSFYISRYPMGREATLNYPSPDIDVKFTNDTGHGIYIRTWHTPTSITVSFYGQNDVERVTAVHGSPRNIKPYPTTRRVNSSLPPESERRVQSGRNGFSVTVTRVVEREGGEESKDDWSWTYVPEREIIEYNPEKRPEPEPEPEPEPDEPSPDASPAPESPPPDEGG